MANPPVPSSTYCADERRLPGVIAEFHAKLVKSNVDSACGGGLSMRPSALEEIASAPNPTWCAQQCLQKRKFDRRQLDGFAVALNGGVRNVDDKIVTADARADPLGVKECTNPGSKFVEDDRLGKDVVGATSKSA